MRVFCPSNGAAEIGAEAAGREGRAALAGQHSGARREIVAFGVEPEFLTIVEQLRDVEVLAGIARMRHGGDVSVPLRPMQRERLCRRIVGRDRRYCVRAARRRRTRRACSVFVAPFASARLAG